MEPSSLTLIEPTPDQIERVRLEWGDLQARHLHLPPEGFSLLALKGDALIGLLGVSWRRLPAPLEESREAFIDIIEVRPAHRRKGIARAMLAACRDRARAAGAYQVRAWSSEDKIEALPMWKALGFGLCPATERSRGQFVRGFFVAQPLDDHG